MLLLIPDKGKNTRVLKTPRFSGVQSQGPQVPGTGTHPACCYQNQQEIQDSLPTPKSIFLPKKGATLLSTSSSQSLALTTQVHLSLAPLVVTQDSTEQEFKQGLVFTKTSPRKARAGPGWQVGGITSQCQHHPPCVGL